MSPQSRDRALEKLLLPKNLTLLGLVKKDMLLGEKKKNEYEEGKK